MPEDVIAQEQCTYRPSVIQLPCQGHPDVVQRTCLQPLTSAIRHMSDSVEEQLSVTQKSLSMEQGEVRSGRVLILKNFHKHLCNVAGYCQTGGQRSSATIQAAIWNFWVTGILTNLTDLQRL